MKKVYTAFLIFLLNIAVVSVSNAHHYHPFLNKTSWLYGCGNFGLSWNNAYKSSAKDTLILSHNYYKIDQVPNSLLGYIREDSIARKVFTTDGIHPEQLLYNFSLIPGDTFIVYSFTVDTLQLSFIDSIPSPIGWLLRQHFNDGTIIVEVVGALDGTDPVFICDGSCLAFSDPECGITGCMQNNVCIYS